MDDEIRRVRAVLAGAAALALTLGALGCDRGAPDTPAAPMAPAAATLASPAPPATPAVPQPAPSPAAAHSRTPGPPLAPAAPPSPTPTATAVPTSRPAWLLGIAAAASFGACDFLLEVADSPQERSIGLMGRERLGQDRGMLFVFEREQILGFWMKNTLIPLDIIFIDSREIVVDVQTMRPEHETAPELPIHESAGPALYAIEVNAGVAATCGIEPGDRATLVNLIPAAGG